MGVLTLLAACMSCAGMGCHAYRRDSQPAAPVDESGKAATSYRYVPAFTHAMISDHRDVWAVFTADIDPLTLPTSAFRLVDGAGRPHPLQRIDAIGARHLAPVHVLRLQAQEIAAVAGPWHLRIESGLRTVLGERIAAHTHRVSESQGPASVSIEAFRGACPSDLMDVSNRSPLWLRVFWTHRLQWQEAAKKPAIQVQASASRIQLVGEAPTDSAWKVAIDGYVLDICGAQADDPQVLQLAADVLQTTDQKRIDALTLPIPTPTRLR